MHERIDPIYSRTWLAINKKTQAYHKLISAQRTLEQKKKIHHDLIKEIEAFRIPALEDAHQYSFKAWIVEKFHENPMELFKNLHRLNFIAYDFHRFKAGELGLISHICTKPKALEILELVFHDLPQHIYQIFPSHPPYVDSELSEPLFSYLIEKHAHFCPPFTPLFWAIQFHDQVLLDKILRLKPEWIDVRDEAGFTPIMVAIHYQNEEAILKLLPLNPNVQLKNFKQETLAHILCKTKNYPWLTKLLKDPNFRGLEISKMLFDPTLKDKEGQIALCQAVYQKSIDFVKDITTYSKQLSPEFNLLPHLYVCYQKAIQLCRLDYLNILHHGLELRLCDSIPHYTSTVLLAFKYYHPEVINWLRSLDHIPVEIILVVDAIDLIYKEQWDAFIEYFRVLEINWENIPPELCFQITISLLEKKRGDLIAQFNLFEIYPSFQHYNCAVRHERIHFIYFLKMHPTPLTDAFIHYFFEYLEKNEGLYPNGMFDYPFEISDIFNIFSPDKNMFHLRTPLLHRLESHLFEKKPEKYLESLQTFIGPEVHLNTLDESQQHLFAKLLSVSNGLERIKNLKTHFPGFSLENLDARASNLLHLATEQGQVATIRWCCAQALDVCAPRATDGKTPLDIALELRNEECLNVLRKQIKKSQFISFLEQLITSNKDELIDYIFHQPKPFDFPFSPFHLKQLEGLSHPRISAFLEAKKVAPTEPQKTCTEEAAAPLVVEAPVVVVAPRKKKALITINHQLLMEMIASKNHKQFEVLIQEDYQDLLRPLFAEHFFVYLKAVFESDCTSLNKTMIRIPAALEKIQEQDTWNILFTDALQTRNLSIIENMFGRQSIADHLKTKALEHLQTALATHPQILFDRLLPHFTPDAESLNTLLEFCVACENPEALPIFLRSKSHRSLVIHAPIALLLQILEKDLASIERLMSFPDLQRFFLSQCKTLFIEALKSSQERVNDNILSLASFRSKFIEAGYDFVIACQEIGLLDRLASKWQAHLDLQKFILPFWQIMRVTLPELVVTAFRMSQSADNTLFLVGSTIHHLIEGKSLETLNDIDFVSPTPPPEAGLYKQSRHQSHLYFNSLFYSKEKQIKLEYFVSSRSPQLFILEDYLSRDFTVNALYCDINGQIYDPSGFGLSDLREKNIRSVEDPRVSFAKDPIRLIRALRLIIKGFELLPEEEAAIIDWQPQEDRINYAHLYAMTNILLQSECKARFFELLLQYELHTKLLKYTPEQTEYLYHFLRLGR